MLNFKKIAENERIIKELGCWDTDMQIVSIVCKGMILYGIFWLAYFLTSGLIYIMD